MSYASADLGLFVPVVLPGELDGTAYFELHSGEPLREHACWMDGSLCVRDAAFDFVCECFHAASPDFDYCSFVPFSPEQTKRLVHELHTFELAVRNSIERQALFSCYSSIFDKAIWANVTADELRPHVLATAQSVREYAEATVARQERLWVLGM